ncbi:MAG: antitoxin Xre/MbcA/ParS toxin-binding domain-containing protein [Trichloromonadaceae bacterium]
MEVLGSQSNATGWLTRELMPLEGKTPVDACRTREGRQQVLNILGRIEHGIFS